MLPEPILDNEEFSEIMDEARNMIVSIFPEWTDFNYHDPGITLVELFAALKENQQYYMDRISEQSREKFLKLLGERRLRKAASRAIVDVEPFEDVVVLTGTKLYAGDVCFVTEETKQLIADDATCWFFAREQIEQIASTSSDTRRAAAVAMFGASPQAGDCFYIGFDSALPQEVDLSLYLELAWASQIRRNPTDGQMTVPMAELGMEFFTDGGWQEVAGFADETQGAIEDGYMRFYIGQEHSKTEIFGQDGYFLRVKLLWQEYDIPPLTQRVSVNCIEVRQRDSIIEQLDVPFEITADGRGMAQTKTIGALNGGSDILVSSGGVLYQAVSCVITPNYDTGTCLFEFEIPERAGEIDFVRIISDRQGGRGGLYLDEGTGFPFQEYDLNDLDTEYESFELMVRDLEHPDEFVQWQRVEDFAASTPEDRHFVFNSRSGTVCFGDCINGLAPEGEIIVTSYVRTFGRGGDITSYKINRFDGLAPEDIKVYNRSDSYGGRDEESLSESFSRVKAQLAAPYAAVCDEDYELRAGQTPGLVIESCKVIPSEQAYKIHKNPVGKLAVNIVVMPAGGVLSPCISRNILAHMEKYRAAGRKINLLAPSRIGFEVFGDIVIAPHYSAARETVSQTVSEFFKRMERRFGTVVSYSELYGELDMLPCVVRINSLNIDARGTGVTRGGDETITLPPNGIASLGEVKLMFSIG